MQIKFYSTDGAELVTVCVDAPDHWEACELGHSMIADGIIAGADDFDVIELPEGVT